MNNLKEKFFDACLFEWTGLNSKPGGPLILFYLFY